MERIENGVIIYDPPLKYKSIVSFAYDHLDCDFIAVSVESGATGALIVACASKPEYSGNVSKLFVKKYEEKGYKQVMGLSSSMVNCIG